MRKEGDIEYAQIRIDTCTLKFIQEFHRRKKTEEILTENIFAIISLSCVRCSR